MKSAIGVLTFNRITALQEVMRGLKKYCSQYPLAIFEDKGLWDPTAHWLAHGTEGVYDHELLANHHKVTGHDVYLGTKNLGVAGNSNRAIRWFVRHAPLANHLCLMNDDLHVDGDFVQAYAQAHKDTGVELFCTCDFTSEQYKWSSFKLSTPSGKTYTMKLLPRMTGIMMSMTRSLIEKIGYYEPEFGVFGEEHVSFTNRARFAGGIRVAGQDLHCLDVEDPHIPLRHQEVPTCLSGEVRKQADIAASTAMHRASRLYPFTSWHRPFRLANTPMTGAYEGVGISTEEMFNHPLAILPPEKVSED